MTSRRNWRGDDPAHLEHGPLGPTAEEQEIFGGLNEADTKTIQLCRQVEEAISCALVCSANPLLRDLYVVGVESLRGAARLRVLVSTEGDHDVGGTTDALSRASGYFRSEVANAIHRKRVPTLSFAVVPAYDDQVDDSDGAVDHE